MPFCPQCREEFQEWVEVCPDCGVALVDKLEPIPRPPEPPEPPPPPPLKISKSIFDARNQVVTVALYYYPGEAYLAAAKLEWEGIPVFVANARTVNNDWLLSGAIGGVKVMVRWKDAHIARIVLSAEEVALADEAQLDTCPNCHSTHIQYQTFNATAVFLIWVITAILLGSPNGAWGFSLPIFRRKWVCRDCGHKWKNLY
jgi:hypothetical protein